MSLRIKTVKKLIELNEDLVFYPKLRKFYRRYLGSGEPLILDVGTNNGQSIDFFLGINKNCRIIGFEPNAKLREKLKTKYELFPNVKIEHYGVSEKKGKLIFNENVLDLTSSFEDADASSEHVKTKSKVLGVGVDSLVAAKYEVEVIDLNSYIAENALGDIDLIKIDVEGHEFQCVKGLLANGELNSEITFVQLESHNDGMYGGKLNPEEISKFLSQHGFLEYQRIKHGFGNFDEIVYKKS